MAEEIIVIFSEAISLIGRMVIWTFERTIDVLAATALVISAVFPHRAWEIASDFHENDSWHFYAFGSLLITIFDCICIPLFLIQLLSPLKWYYLYRVLAEYSYNQMIEARFKIFYSAFDLIPDMIFYPCFLFGLVSPFRIQMVLVDIPHLPYDSSSDYLNSWWNYKWSVILIAIFVLFDYVILPPGALMTLIVPSLWNTAYHSFVWTFNEKFPPRLPTETQRRYSWDDWLDFYFSLYGLSIVCFLGGIVDILCLLPALFSFLSFTRHTAFVRVLSLTERRQRRELSRDGKNPIQYNIQLRFLALYFSLLSFLDLFFLPLLLPLWLTQWRYIPIRDRLFQAPPSPSTHIIPASSSSSPSPTEVQSAIQSKSSVEAAVIKVEEGKNRQLLSEQQEEAYLDRQWGLKELFLIIHQFLLLLLDAFFLVPFLPPLFLVQCFSIFSHRYLNSLYSLLVPSSSPSPHSSSSISLSSSQTTTFTSIQPNAISNPSSYSLSSLSPHSLPSENHSSSNLHGFSRVYSYLARVASYPPAMGGSFRWRRVYRLIKTDSFKSFPAALELYISVLAQCLCVVLDMVLVLPVCCLFFLYHLICILATTVRNTLDPTPVFSSLPIPSDPSTPPPPASNMLISTQPNYSTFSTPTTSPTTTTTSTSTTSSTSTTNTPSSSSGICSPCSLLASLASSRLGSVRWRAIRIARERESEAHLSDLQIFQEEGLDTEPPPFSSLTWTNLSTTLSLYVSCVSQIFLAALDLALVLPISSILLMYNLVCSALATISRIFLRSNNNNNAPISVPLSDPESPLSDPSPSPSSSTPSTAPSTQQVDSVSPFYFSGSLRWRRLKQAMEQDDGSNIDNIFLTYFLCVLLPLLVLGDLIIVLPSRFICLLSHVICLIIPYRSLFLTPLRSLNIEATSWSNLHTECAHLNPPLFFIPGSVRFLTFEQSLRQDDGSIKRACENLLVAFKLLFFLLIDYCFLLPISTLLYLTRVRWAPLNDAIWRDEGKLTPAGVSRLDHSPSVETLTLYLTACHQLLMLLLDVLLFPFILLLLITSYRSHIASQMYREPYTRHKTPLTFHLTVCYETLVLTHDMLFVLPLLLMLMILAPHRSGHWQLFFWNLFFPSNNSSQSEGETENNNPSKNRRLQISRSGLTPNSPSPNFSPTISSEEKDTLLLVEVICDSLLNIYPTKDPQTNQLLEPSPDTTRPLGSLSAGQLVLVSRFLHTEENCFYHRIHRLVGFNMNHQSSSSSSSPRLTDPHTSTSPSDPLTNEQLRGCWVPFSLVSHNPSVSYLDFVLFNEFEQCISSQNISSSESMTSSLLGEDWRETIWFEFFSFLLDIPFLLLSIPVFVTIWRAPLLTSLILQQRRLILHTQSQYAQGKLSRPLYMKEKSKAMSSVRFACFIQMVYLLRDILFLIPFSILLGTLFRLPGVLMDLASRLAPPPLKSKRTLLAAKGCTVSFPDVGAPLFTFQFGEDVPSVSAPSSLTLVMRMHVLGERLWDEVSSLFGSSVVSVGKVMLPVKLSPDGKQSNLNQFLSTLNPTPSLQHQHSDSQSSVQSNSTQDLEKQLISHPTSSPSPTISDANSNESSSLWVKFDMLNVKRTSVMKNLKRFPSDTPIILQFEVNLPASSNPQNRVFLRVVPLVRELLGAAESPSGTLSLPVAALDNSRYLAALKASGRSPQSNNNLETNDEDEAKGSSDDSEEIRGEFVDSFHIITGLAFLQLLVDIFHLLLFCLICLFPWRLIQLLSELFEPSSMYPLSLAKRVSKGIDKGDDLLQTFRSSASPFFNRDLKKFNLSGQEEEVSAMENTTLKAYRSISTRMLKLLEASSSEEINPFYQHFVRRLELQDSLFRLWCFRFASYRELANDQVPWAQYCMVSSIINGAHDATITEIVRNRQLLREDLEGIKFQIEVQKKEKTKKGWVGSLLESGLFTRSIDKTREIIRASFLKCGLDMASFCVFLFIVLTLVRLLPLMNELIQKKVFSPFHYKTRLIAQKHARQISSDLWDVTVFALHLLLLLALVIPVPACLMDLPEHMSSLRVATQCIRSHITDFFYYLYELFALLFVFRTYFILVNVLLYGSLIPGACLAEADPTFGLASSTKSKFIVGTIFWIGFVIFAILVSLSALTLGGTYTSHTLSKSNSSPNDVNHNLLGFGIVMSVFLVLISFSFARRQAYKAPSASALSLSSSATWSHVLAVLTAPFESIQLSCVVLYFFWSSSPGSDSQTDTSSSQLASESVLNSLHSGTDVVASRLLFWGNGSGSHAGFVAVQSVAVGVVLLWAFLVTLPLAIWGEQDSEKKRQAILIKSTPVYEFLTVLLSRIFVVWIIATLMRPASCMYSQSSSSSYQYVLSTDNSIPCGGSGVWASGCSLALLVYFLLTTSVIGADEAELLDDQLNQAIGVRFSPVYGLIMRLLQLFVCSLCLGAFSSSSSASPLVPTILACLVMSILPLFFKNRVCSFSAVVPLRTAGAMCVAWTALICLARRQETSSLPLFLQTQTTLFVGWALLFLASIFAAYRIQILEKQSWMNELIQNGLDEIITHTVGAADALLVEEILIGKKSVRIQQRVEEFKEEMRNALSPTRLALLIASFEDSIVVDRLHPEFLRNRSAWLSTLLNGRRALDRTLRTQVSNYSAHSPTEIRGLTLTKIASLASELQQGVIPPPHFVRVSRLLLTVILKRKLPEEIAWKIYEYCEDSQFTMQTIQKFLDTGIRVVGMGRGQSAAESPKKREKLLAIAASPYAFTSGYSNSTFSYTLARQFCWMIQDQMRPELLTSRLKDLSAKANELTPWQTANSLKNNRRPSINSPPTPSFSQIQISSPSSKSPSIEFSGENNEFPDAIQYPMTGLNQHSNLFKVVDPEGAPVINNNLEQIAVLPQGYIVQIVHPNSASNLFNDGFLWINLAGDERSVKFMGPDRRPILFPSEFDCSQCTVLEQPVKVFEGPSDTTPVLGELRCNTIFVHPQALRFDEPGYSLMYMFQAPDSDLKGFVYYSRSGRDVLQRKKQFNIYTRVNQWNRSVLLAQKTQLSLAVVHITNNTIPIPSLDEISLRLYGYSLPRLPKPQPPLGSNHPFLTNDYHLKSGFGMTKVGTEYENNKHSPSSKNQFLQHVLDLLQLTGPSHTFMSYQFIARGNGYFATFIKLAKESDDPRVTLLVSNILSWMIQYPSMPPQFRGFEGSLLFILSRSIRSASPFESPPLLLHVLSLLSLVKDNSRTFPTLSTLQVRAYSDDNNINSSDVLSPITLLRSTLSLLPTSEYSLHWYIPALRILLSILLAEPSLLSPNGSSAILCSFPSDYQFFLSVLAGLSPRLSPDPAGSDNSFPDPIYGSPLPPFHSSVCRLFSLLFSSLISFVLDSNSLDHYLKVSLADCDSTLTSLLSLPLSPPPSPSTLDSFVPLLESLLLLLNSGVFSMYSEAVLSIQSTGGLSSESSQSSQSSQSLLLHRYLELLNPLSSLSSSSPSPSSSSFHSLLSQCQAMMTSLLPTPLPLESSLDETLMASTSPPTTDLNLHDSIFTSEV